MWMWTANKFQNFTQKDSTEVKIFQKVLGGYFCRGLWSGHLCSGGFVTFVQGGFGPGCICQGLMTRGLCLGAFAQWAFGLGLISRHLRPGFMCGASVRGVYVQGAFASGSFGPGGGLCQGASGRSLSSSRMRVINHNWSATKQRLYPQSAAEISHHLVLSGDRIRQCGTSSGSRHKDTDQCL